MQKMTVNYAGNNSQTTETNELNKKNRVYYLDWLRVLAMTGVFLYHCDRFFDYRTYPIQNITRSMLSTIHREFYQIWLMPIFFVISGAAVVYSLQSHGAKSFIKNRIVRIMIPFVFAGLFILSPPQIYIERVIKGEFTGSFIQWYPNYFNGLYLFTHDGNFPIFSMHLWYLSYLFIFSLLLLPLFIINKKKKISVLAQISAFFVDPLRLFFLCVPLSIFAIVTEIAGFATIRMAGGWDPLSYITFFVFGYMIFSNQGIQNSIKKHSIIFLIISIVLTVIYLLIGLGENSPDLSIINRHNIIHTMKSLPSKIPLTWLCLLSLRSVVAWCWILSLLGFCARLLNFKNRFLEYSNEAVLPFYILHQTFLLVIGYFIIQLEYNTLSKYLIIVSLSFVTIMLVYEFVIKQVNVFRFLFGMKSDKRQNKL